MQSYEPPKLRESQLGNFGTPTWESRDKMSLGCGLHGEAHSILKGEGGGFPQIQAMMSLVSPSCL